MPNLTVRIIILVIIGLLAGSVQADPKSKVPRTGQVLCYPDSPGLAPPPIPCDGTGQDGEIQAGVEWPSPRFRDNGDGTIRDGLTKLTWLKNANCLATSGLGPFDDTDGAPDDGMVFWQTALDFANALESGQCGLSDGSDAGDWRLPNVRELHSLIDYGQLEPAIPVGHPFTNLQEQGAYYSATSDENATARAWFVSFFDGIVFLSFKTMGDFHAIAVTGGNVAD